MTRAILIPFALTSALIALGCNKADEQAGHAVQTDQAMHQDHAMTGEHAARATAQQAHPGAPIAINVGDHGFDPSKIEVKKGTNVTLRFTRTSDATCAKAVVFPELKLKKQLPLNQPVDIQIPATESRTLTFQCGMGMYKSQVVITS